MVGDPFRRTVWDDLDAGEEPLTLNVARHLPALRVNGRSHDITWIHRATTRGCRGADGSRVVLETTVISGKKLTTKSAVLRFIRRQGVVKAATASAPPRQQMAAPRTAAPPIRSYADSSERLARAGI